jgi:mannose-1-phosphate guanylyltransferase
VTCLGEDTIIHVLASDHEITADEIYFDCRAHRRD